MAASLSLNTTRPQGTLDSVNLFMVIIPLLVGVLTPLTYI